jgi:hypothetical protein
MGLALLPSLWLLHLHTSHELVGLALLTYGLLLLLTPH